VVCVYFALWIRSGDRAIPEGPIHSIAVIHFYLLFTFLDALKEREDSSRESVGESRSQGIKRVSALSNRDILAVMVSLESHKGRIFGVGKYSRLERINVAKK
jgi:hypothetical protein